MKKDVLRKLPSVDELMLAGEMRELAAKYNRNIVVNAVRVVLSSLRKEIIETEIVTDEKTLSIEAISELVVSRFQEQFTASLRKAVNATGIILHTGLGRAVLSCEAIDAVDEVARGYCTLATGMDTGRRGHRDVHLNELLCTLTGAEAATVVNNNAAATMLILNTLAKGREVIVSRGQLVEIGGSFRMPEVMETSGAILREVGTTNKTHLKDYIDAVNENTGAILRVHQSNYRIVGFTGEPGIGELVKVAKEYNLPVIDDLGSGALADLQEYGLETEPMAQDSIEAGVDAACFSGDKLIGGPQAGVIVGKTPTIEKIRMNPLARAFRVGKMTIAGMEATLKLFLNREKLDREHPFYRMLKLSPEKLEKRAGKIADTLRDSFAAKADISVADGVSRVGSGSVPTETIPTKLLSVRPVVMSADSLAKRLRYNEPPVFARVYREKVLFDFRTIQPEEDVLVQKAVTDILRDRKA